MKRLEVVMAPYSDEFEKAVVLLDGVIITVHSITQEMTMKESGLSAWQDLELGGMRIFLTTNNSTINLGIQGKDVECIWRRGPMCAECNGKGWVNRAMMCAECTGKGWTA